MLAAVAHLEGAEAVDPDLDSLELWHAAGLRSLGPVWSRPNAFAHGVPFAFPSSPDTGPGLTPAGRALVGRCAELGIAFDLSHLNEAGFWDVARLDRAPLIASHSGVHALCPASRNLTDEQLDAIGASGGLVGNRLRGQLPARGRRRGRRHAAGDHAPTTRATWPSASGSSTSRSARTSTARRSPPSSATPPASRGCSTRCAPPASTEAELEAIAWGNWRRVLEVAWA